MLNYFYDNIASLLILLAHGIMFQPTHAKTVAFNPGEDLNSLINNAKGGDTILIKP